MQRLLILLLTGMVLFSGHVFAAPGKSAVPDKEPARSYGAVDVVLYETSWCPYCTKARKLLNEMGVSLVSYDIEKDREKRAEMLEKTGGSRGVPVIDVEGIVLHGYSEEDIRLAVEKQRRK